MEGQDPQVHPGGDQRHAARKGQDLDFFFKYILFTELQYFFGLTRKDPDRLIYSTYIIKINVHHI